MTLYGVIPAAGVGRRMQARCPKQYLKLHGRFVVDWSVEALLRIDGLQTVMVAIGEGDPYWLQTQSARKQRVSTVIGGSERAHSVYNALRALSQNASSDAWVLVHDAARPCVRLTDIQKLLQLAVPAGGGLLGVPVTDTIKQIQTDRRISKTLDRSVLWRAFTPQLFPLHDLQEALAQALQKGLPITDEASAMEQAGFQPLLVLGHADNIKITQPGDLELAAYYLACRRP